jgi:hypothetical protein
MHRPYTNIHWYVILKIKKQPLSILAKVHPKSKIEEETQFLILAIHALLLHAIMQFG